MKSMDGRFNKISFKLTFLVFVALVLMSACMNYPNILSYRLIVYDLFQQKLAQPVSSAEYILNNSAFGDFRKEGNIFRNQVPTTKKNYKLNNKQYFCYFKPLTQQNSDKLIDVVRTYYPQDKMQHILDVHRKKLFAYPACPLPFYFLQPG